MNFKSLCLAVTCGIALMAGSAHAQAPIVGSPAPDYAYTDTNGAKHTISGYKGKVVVLEWTNPGCPFVKKYYSKGDMQKIQSNALKDPNVVWVSINSSGEGKEGYLATDADAKTWLSEQKASPTSYVRDPSGAFGKLYGAKTTPHMFVIDKDGNLAYQGGIDNLPSPNQDDIVKAIPYIPQVLEALRNGRTPTVQNSPPYGCGVKYAEAAVTPVAPAAPAITSTTAEVGTSTTPGVATSPTTPSVAATPTPAATPTAPAPVVISK